MSHLQVHELESIKVKPEARQCGETDSRHMASGQSSPFHPNSPITSWQRLPAYCALSLRVVWRAQCWAGITCHIYYRKNV